jgi:hypothetical protein
LRAAIADANTNSGGTITFQAGLTGTITLASDLPAITQPLTIQGPGASTIAIDGASNFRVFYLGVPDAVTISGLTLEHSSWAPLSVKGGGTLTADSVALVNNATTHNRGGGFYCHGTLSVLSSFTLTNSTVTGNTTTGGGGGGFAGGCNATIATTTIANNSAPNRDGGGLYFNSYGNKAVENSTISGNTAGDNSGGVYVSDYAGSTLTISNTTISGNTAVNQAGGIGGNSVGDKFSLIESTVTGNIVTSNPNTSRTPVGGLYLSDSVGGEALSGSGSASPDQTQKQQQHAGLGVAAVSSHINIVGSIVWGNTTSSPGTVDVGFGGKTDAPGSTNMNSDHSLLGTVDPNVTIIDQGGTLTGVNPLLGPLADNGGPTQTHALLAGSPAIDTGPNPLPTFALNANDQRGAGFPRVVGAAVDIGAFEVQPPPTPVPAPAPAIIIAPRFTG